MSLRVSELQVLLGYAGRNKHGRKHELLTKALHLLKAGCSPAVQMKIKELYRRRFPTKMVSPVDLTLPGVHSASSLPAGLAQLGFDSHGSPSPLLPVSLLGPKHELSLPHLPSSLHPVHPDVKLQRLPFYDVLDELIKPTSLGESSTSRTALCVVIMHILMEHRDRRYPNHDLSLRVQYESTLMLGEFCGFPFDHRLRFLFFFSLAASDNSQRFQEACYAFALTPQQVQQISSSMYVRKLPGAHSLHVSKREIIL